MLRNRLTDNRSLAFVVRLARFAKNPTNFSKRKLQAPLVDFDDGITNGFIPKFFLNSFKSRP
jgi:hypothetical protein